MSQQVNGRSPVNVAFVDPFLEQRAPLRRHNTHGTVAVHRPVHASESRVDETPSAAVISRRCC
jgi:hypothetical protein